MRFIQLITIGMLAASLAACGSTTAERTALQTQVAQLTVEQLAARQNLQAELIRTAGLSAELTRSAAETAELRARLTQQAASAATQVAAGAAQIADLTNQRDLAAANYQDLLERTRCQTGSSSPFDLSEHAAVSRSLKALIADYEDADPTASWEIVPGHPGSAIHRVYGREAWVFVVSLAVQDAARGTSVFWVEEQCFLDLPGLE